MVYVQRYIRVMVYINRCLRHGLCTENFQRDWIYIAKSAGCDIYIYIYIYIYQCLRIYLYTAIGETWDTRSDG